jgi:hypothetical protein
MFVEFPLKIICNGISLHHKKRTQAQIFMSYIKENGALNTTGEKRRIPSHLGFIKISSMFLTCFNVENFQSSDSEPGILKTFCQRHFEDFSI